MKTAMPIAQLTELDDFLQALQDDAARAQIPYQEVMIFSNLESSPWFGSDLYYRRMRASYLRSVAPHRPWDRMIVCFDGQIGPRIYPGSEYVEQVIQRVDEEAQATRARIEKTAQRLVLRVRAGLTEWDNAA